MTITGLEIQEMAVCDTMVRPMALQSEAERDRRAHILLSEGEEQASVKLVEAASNLTKNQASLQLKYLQTLSEIAKESTSTIIMPLPMVCFQFPSFLDSRLAFLKSIFLQFRVSVL